MKKIILKCLVFTAVIFITQKSLAQAMQRPAFNHQTIYVVDLQKGSDFYENVMQLEKITEPFHDGRHTWFKIGEHSQLHVVSGAKEIIPHDINIHLAFSVASLETFMKHLDDLQIKYGNWKADSKAPQIRPDKIKQIYLQDPDGYWLEVNDDKF
ncbi:MAG: VOC family protein [Ginsengibacter sp.]